MGYRRFHTPKRGGDGIDLPDTTFQGTFATGDYSQWNNIQNINWNDPVGKGAGYPITGLYPLQIVADAAAPGGGGYAARFECRNGDYPGFPSGERTEIAAHRGGTYGGFEGQEHWYEWAIKFDPSFPTTGVAGSWSVLSQWKMLSDNGSPPISWNVQNQNNRYSLCLNRQSAPGTYLSTNFAVDCPLDVGNWHIYRMKVIWSTSDSVGKLRVWRDGVPLTMNYHATFNPTTSTEWTVRTMIPAPATPGCYWREGIYRQQNSLGTWIVSFAGSNAAADSSDLLDIGGYTHATPPTPAPAFVTRTGATLMLNGSPYRFVGVNNPELSGAQTGSVPSASYQNAFFAQLPPNTVVRTWGFEEWGLAQLDRTVAAATAAGVKLCIALADGSGNNAQPVFTVPWYQGGYVNNIMSVGGIAGPVNTNYWNWIALVCDRFKASTAIAWWDVMNEPGNTVYNTLSTTDAANFLEAAAARIKTYDPNHLVGTGFSGWPDFGVAAADYQAIHAGSHIDIISVHDYQYPASSGVDYGYTGTDNAVAAGVALNKPVVVGELGISKASGTMTAAERAAAMNAKFDLFFGKKQDPGHPLTFTTPVAGDLYWAVISAAGGGNNGNVVNSAYGNDDTDQLGGAVMDAIAAYRPFGAAVFNPAVVFNTVSTTALDVTSYASGTNSSFTIPSIAQGALTLVFAVARNPSSARASWTSYTLSVAGTSFTSLGFAEFGGGTGANGGWIEAFWCSTPMASAGSKSVSVKYTLASATIGNLHCHGMAFTWPVSADTPVTASGTGATPSVTVPSGVNDMVAAAMVTTGGSMGATLTGGTMRFNRTSAAPFTLGGTAPGVAGNITLSGSAASGNWAAIGVNLQAP